MAHPFGKIQPHKQVTDLESITDYIMAFCYQFTPYGKDIARAVIRDLVWQYRHPRTQQAILAYANPANWRHEEGRWYWIGPGEGMDEANWALESQKERPSQA